jgi:hypothetical protein
LSCLGKIQPPPNGTRFIVLPGSTVEIKWSFDDKIDTVLIRLWHFSNSSTQLATIFRDEIPEINKDHLLRVKIEKPATLVLKNVNDNYNGMYRFSLTVTTARDPFKSEVTVVIASKFSLSKYLIFLNMMVAYCMSMVLKQHLSFAFPGTANGRFEISSPNFR